MVRCWLLCLVVLWPTVAQATVLDLGCGITSILENCRSPQNPNQWPEDQPFAFSRICTQECPDQSNSELFLSNPVTLEELEMIRGSDGASVRGEFVDENENCQCGPLIRFTGRLQSGRDYIVRLRGEVLFGFTVEGEQPRPRRSSWHAWFPGWDDYREDWVWELSLGGSVNFTRDREDNALLYTGGSFSIGFRRVLGFHGGAILGDPSEHWVFGAPLNAFFFPMFIFMPISGFLGNELGVDVHVQAATEVLEGAPEVWLSVGLRPVFNVARDHIVRNTSTVGMYLPEIGIEWAQGRRSAFYVEWCLSSYAIRIHSHFAIEWRLARGAVVVPFDGSPVEGRISTELVLIAH